MSAAAARKLEIACSFAFHNDPPPQITEEEYEEFLADSKEKLEFLDGKIIMMAGGSYSHSLLKANAVGELRSAFRKLRCRVLDSDMKLKVEATGLNTFPDASVVCENPKFKDGRELSLLNPSLIVEVLSQTTEAYDRGEKFWHYRQILSLNTYVLISATAVRIEVYEVGDDREWHLSTFNGMDAVMKLRHYGIEIPLAAIYEMTPLEPDRRLERDEG